MQVGADYGALTGLFKRRVKAVTVWDESEEQLDIVRERFPDTSEGAPVCLRGRSAAGAASGGKEIRLCGLCRGSFKSLRTSGRKSCGIWQSLAETVTAAVCNRFGLKYLAGGKRDQVSLTRNRLSALFPGCAFYYPMPDYRVPTVIYSDRCLPSKGSWLESIRCMISRSIRPSTWEPSLRPPVRTDSLLILRIPFLLSGKKESRPWQRPFM